MPTPDEAEVRSQTGQAILQAYQAYKNSGGQTAPAKAPTPAYSPPPQAKEFQSSSPQINISSAQLQRTNALRAQEDLPPLQEVANVRTVEATHSSYGPQPQQIKSQQSTPDTGVLTGKQQIQKTHDTINQISTDFQAAKDAGVKEIQVKDSSGRVIGTVNPQNVPMARLQYLNLTKQGAVRYEYTTTSSSGQNGVTSTLTSYKPMNVLTAFTGGALGGFAELGLIGLGLVAKATGKPITIPGTNYTAQPTGVLQQAQQRVQKTFGKETLDKIISGEKVDFNNPIEVASLTGLGASIIATGGVGGVKAAVSAPSRLVQALRAPAIARTISKTELQEGNALSHLDKVKGGNTLFEFEQASIQKTKTAPAKIPDIIKVERLPNGQVQAVRVSSPSKVEVPVNEQQKPIDIPYGVIQTAGKSATTSLVTKVTNLTPQEVAIKGLPLEVGAKMGLTRVESGGFPIYTGKLTSKNIPLLMDEIRAGNIKPTFDILQYPTKDIGKGGGRYGLLSRNPEMLSSNSFERVTRPSVTRYFEGKLELEKGFKPAVKGTVEKTPLSSRGKQVLVKEEKPEVGKLSKEEKQIVQTVTKQELTRQTPALKAQATQTTTSQTTYAGLTHRTQTRQEEEIVYLTSPKSATTTKTMQRQTLMPVAVLGRNNQRTKQEQQKPKTGLISKTTGITTQKQFTTVRPKQITKTGQTLIPKEPGAGGGQPDIPPGRKRLGGLIPGFNTLSGGLGNVSKSGSRLGYTGNVPLNSIVGIYNRSETSYGNVRAPRSSAPKPSKLSKSKKFRL